jgi:hypothetical protein
VIDLPALNSQFTKMVLTVDGTANWGANEYGYWTSYANGTYTGTGAPMTTGVWNNGGVEDGELLLEGTQVGKVVYRVDGGQWQEVTTTTITANDGGTHAVQVAYNDRPGSYYDNSGSLSLTVVRTKA